MGQKLPNAWGLYDMHGNVFELCQDWSSVQLPGGMAVDPRGPDTGTCRVICGGGWNGGDEWSNAGFSRSAFHFNYSPDDRNKIIGFRVVLAPGQSLLACSDYITAPPYFRAPSDVVTGLLQPS